MVWGLVLGAPVRQELGAPAKFGLGVLWFYGIPGSVPKKIKNKLGPSPAELREVGTHDDENQAAVKNYSTHPIVAIFLSHLSHHNQALSRAWGLRPEEYGIRTGLRGARARLWACVQRCLHGGASIGG